MELKIILFQPLSGRIWKTMEDYGRIWKNMELKC